MPDNLREALARIVANGRTPLTEEATKMAMIVPFFAALGYDVFNPAEFMPEFTADVGIKKGEKVDYAILQDGSPVMIIEAKAAGTDLTPHRSQLFRYFATTPARVAVLTNGLEYRFFTDMDSMNVMDEAPFLTIRLDDMSDADLADLDMFRKGAFKPKTVQDEAHRLKYQGVFLDMLRRQFEKPSYEFLSLFVGQLCGGKKSKVQTDRFRPALEAAMRMFLEDRGINVGDGMDAPGEPQDVPREAVLDMPADRAKKNMGSTGKPSGFTITGPDGSKELSFASHVAMTLALCDEIIAVYGFDMFRDTVCGHVFFEKSKVRKVFSMDEVDMRGFGHHMFHGRLYMLTNYSADTLGKIRKQLLELFPMVTLELKYENGEDQNA